MQCSMDSLKLTLARCRIQTMCAKLVLNYKRMDSTTEVLKILHWIPIRLRITFKIFMIVHKCPYGTAPTYLKDLLIRTPAQKRNLRSSIDQSRLIIPRTKLKTFASRSFSVSGPKSYELFKKEVKTHYHYGRD